jgi:hypothetical protein
VLEEGLEPTTSDYDFGLDHGPSGARIVCKASNTDTDGGQTMIERIEDMPAGTVGLRASGKLTREEYHEALEPALQEAAESGEIRMLFLLTDFDGLAPSAWLTDAETGLRYAVGHHSAWKRLAFVTDSDWLRKAMHTFAWLTPGELMICTPDELEQARSWVAG